MRIGPLELDSATLGTSLLYGSIAVTDEQGKKLEVKDSSWGADPRVTLTVPEKVHEVILAISDLRGQGGPAYGYRLVALPEAGDYTLQLLTPYVNVPARGTVAIRGMQSGTAITGPSGSAFRISPMTSFRPAETSWTSLTPP